MPRRPRIKLAEIPQRPAKLVAESEKVRSNRFWILVLEVDLYEFGCDKKYCNVDPFDRWCNGKYFFISDTDAGREMSGKPSTQCRCGLQAAVLGKARKQCVVDLVILWIYKEVRINEFEFGKTECDADPFGSRARKASEACS